MGGKRKERGSGGCERAIEEKREVSNGSGGKDDGRNYSSSSFISPKQHIQIKTHKTQMLHTTYNIHKELGNGRGKLY